MVCITHTLPLILYWQDHFTCLSSLQCFFLIGLPGSCLHVLHVWLFLRLFVQASSRTLLEYSRKFTFQLRFSTSLLAFPCTQPVCLACFLADVFLHDAFVCFSFSLNNFSCCLESFPPFSSKWEPSGSVWHVSHRIWAGAGTRAAPCILSHWVPGQGQAAVAASASSSTPCLSLASLGFSSSYSWILILLLFLQT